MGTKEGKEKKARDDMIAASGPPGAPGAQRSRLSLKTPKNPSCQGRVRAKTRTHSGYSEPEKGGSKKRVVSPKRKSEHKRKRNGGVFFKDQKRRSGCIAKRATKGVQRNSKKGTKTPGRVKPLKAQGE